MTLEALFLSCVNELFVDYSPTPRVTWKRIGGEMPVRHRLESFGQQLTIDNVQFSDAGKYECQGINDMAMVPVRRSMELSVECEWRIAVFPFCRVAPVFCLFLITMSMSVVNL